MRIWVTVVLVSVATWLMKASGPLLLGDRRLPPVAVRVTALAAPVLLAALIVSDLAGDGWHELEWTRVTGVGVAGLASLLRAPMLLAVLLGAVTAALLRMTLG
jgi:branched-subunit amino acid transport protein